VAAAQAKSWPKSTTAPRPHHSERAGGVRHRLWVAGSSACARKAAPRKLGGEARTRSGSTAPAKTPPRRIRCARKYGREKASYDRRIEKQENEPGQAATGPRDGRSTGRRDRAPSVANVTRGRARRGSRAPQPRLQRQHLRKTCLPANRRIARPIEANTQAGHRDL